MGKLFGTDGVRGIANADLTPELAFRLGEVAAYVLRDATQNEDVFFNIGRDTRISGDMLEAALTAGICSQGVNVRNLGVCPTPAVAYLTVESNAAAGVVISASHNPFMDNGIKFFSGSGYKLFDAVEEKIEKIIASENKLERPVGEKLGRVYSCSSMCDKYAEYAAKIPSRKFDGLKIVIDCANGAASDIAPEIWKKTGAEVVFINNDHNGVNINVECGSTHPDHLCREVVRSKADIGIAYDGDADRVIMCDEKGQLVDGDRIIFICALHLQEQGLLANSSVVVTVMSNMGLELALREKGISVEKSAVGDRYVLEKMLEKNIILGGEQSGHIIFKNLNTTGDGILTSLQVVDTVMTSGKKISEIVAPVVSMPQKLVNVQVRDKKMMDGNADIEAALAFAELKLHGNGRILLRPSGTEQLIRIMVESSDESALDEALNYVADKVRCVMGS